MHYSLVYGNNVVNNCVSTKDFKCFASNKEVQICATTHLTSLKKNRILILKAFFPKQLKSPNYSI